jgi:hypothetical protein
MKEPSEAAIQSGKDADAWRRGFDAGSRAVQFWENPQNLRDLIVYLDQGDEGELDRQEILYLLSKPWKWRNEYEAMRAAEKEPK